MCPPAAGDSGAALGAALWWTARRGRATTRPVLFDAYLGLQFDETVCRSAAANAGLTAETLTDGPLYERLQKKSWRSAGWCFWYQGGWNGGPRALGNRSLLADPRREHTGSDQQQRSNAVRHSVRSHHSILAERAQEFDPTGPFPVYAQRSPSGSSPPPRHAPCRDMFTALARVQTVTREANPRFYDLLAAFGRRTGIPVLLNTSFNVQEPIVCS